MIPNFVYKEHLNYLIFIIGILITVTNSSVPLNMIHGYPCNSVNLWLLSFRDSLKDSGQKVSFYLKNNSNIQFNVKVHFGS